MKRFFVFSAVLVLVILMNVKRLMGEDCTYERNGKPDHYFDNYTEVFYDLGCGHLCRLNVSDDLEVASLKFIFPNRTEPVNCSWVIPGFANGGLSTVMFFEQTKPESLTHDVLCDQSSPSLSLWDSYSAGETEETTYSICRNPEENRPEAYSRRSSRLGSFDTLMTLTNYHAQPFEERVLLKYVTVDWSEDCVQHYREITVDLGWYNTTSLGFHWFTSNLRLPNEMHCRWKLVSEAAASPNYMIRLRVALLRNASLQGYCVDDDRVDLKDSSSSANVISFHFCADPHPFFFYSLTGFIYIDFYSGPELGAPQFELSYSTMERCPVSPLDVDTDLVENVVYGLTDGSQASTCRWRLYTNWTNNVIMLTRVLCTGDGGHLDVDQGPNVRRVPLCQLPATLFPLWSDRPSMALDLISGSPEVSIFYKNVPKVPACQGLPVQAKAVPRVHGSGTIDLEPHRTHREVSAPDCRWQVHPSPQMASTDQYVAEVVVSDSLNFRYPSVTTARWMISGFRAYPGTVRNESSALRPDCQFSSKSVDCTFISTTPSLLLVYDPSLSTSPIPIKIVTYTFREIKKVSSGQTGSALPGPWHALLLLSCSLVALRFSF
ncbi:uncharacterized protein LOC143282811 [Babylonia areolata]|uniref:uncharacterized protein LOC143282811 n=1 Tax=Babylonia areolata TaxID=304850 RepID=UPI003FD1F1DE